MVPPWFLLLSILAILEEKLWGKWQTFYTPEAFPATQPSTEGNAKPDSNQQPGFRSSFLYLSLNF